MVRIPSFSEIILEIPSIQILTILSKMRTFTAAAPPRSLRTIWIRAPYVRRRISLVSGRTSLKHLSERRNCDLANDWCLQVDFRLDDAGRVFPSFDWVEHRIQDLLSVCDNLRASYHLFNSVLQYPFLLRRCTYLPVAFQREGILFRR